MLYIFNWNSLINFCLILISILLGMTISPLYFLIWPIALILDDLSYYLLKKSIFNTEIRVKAGYQFAHTYLDDISKKGRDLGFNLYDGVMSKTKQQAQIDKWDFMLKELKLKPGDRLIDIGCGYGDWLNYAKQKGIDVVGVNISPEQADAAKRNFAMEVICVNWKDILHDKALQKKLYTQFDAVTFMDTVEHYVSSRYRHDIEMQGKIYGSMFELANNLLKPSSSSQRVFISCIHWVKKLYTPREYLSVYLLDKYHSGFYPFGDEGLTKWAKPYFNEVNKFDKTEDYRLTSVLDGKHFGAPKIKWTLKKLLCLPILFLTDPHHLHKWLDIKTDTWMWWHFGDNAYNPNYDNEYQRQKRRVTLWWLVLEKKDSCQYR